MPVILEKRLVELGCQFRFSELAIIAHSLHKMYIAISQDNKEVAKIFFKVPH